MASEGEARAYGKSLVDRLQQRIDRLSAIQASGLAKEEIDQAIAELQKDIDALARWAPFVFIGADDE